MHQTFSPLYLSQVGVGKNSLPEGVCFVALQVAEHPKRVALPVLTLLEVLDHGIPAAALGEHHIWGEEEVAHAVGEADKASTTDGCEECVRFNDDPGLLGVLPGALCARGAEPTSAHVGVELLHPDVL